VHGDFVDENRNLNEFYGLTTEMLGIEINTMSPATTTVETTTIPISEYF
jgi:hypothetical protein